MKMSLANILRKGLNNPTNAIPKQRMLAWTGLAGGIVFACWWTNYIDEQAAPSLERRLSKRIQNNKK